MSTDATYSKNPGFPLFAPARMRRSLPRAVAQDSPDVPERGRSEPSVPERPERGLRPGDPYPVFRAAILFCVPLLACSAVPSGNRLAEEKSPYLRLHASNPVDWLPWGEEALERARREDRPLFISIGYSTCRWCHVMARESFENEAIAKRMNEGFVCVKVDREERPDVDYFYLSAARAMGWRTGWPTSVWATPDGRPFFIGVYFPPEDREGEPGFPTLLQRFAKEWREARGRLEEQAETAVRAVLAAHEPLREAPVPPDVAVAEIKKTFDAKRGGFGPPPRFPRPPLLELLLRWHARAGDVEALRRVEATVHAIRLGAIHDQIGGGVHRYAVDAAWRVPHFEKMLYDQALLSRVCLQLFQITGNPEYAEFARETLDFVLREMTSADGAFFSALDAESAGREGAFYLWTAEEIRKLLPGRAGEVFCRAWGVTGSGHPSLPAGLHALYRARTAKELAAEFGLDEDRVERLVCEGRERLRIQRNRRVRPAVDDWVLLDWNALAIGSFALAGAVLEEPRYIDAARRAWEFARRNLRGGDGWLHGWREGAGKAEAFLDDHAYLAQALFLLYQATFEEEFLEECERVVEALRGRFRRAEGGFFLGPPGPLPRLVRKVEREMPSGLGVAAMLLGRLGDLFGREEWKRDAAVSEQFGGNPFDQPTLVSARLGNPTVRIVIAGAGGEAERMIRLLRRRYLPDVVVVRIPPEGASPRLLRLVPSLAGLGSPGAAQAFVHVGGSRVLAARNADELERWLDGR